MYKNIAFLFVAFVLSSGCFKTTQKVNTTEFSLVKREKSLLWQVEGKELQKPSYIFGTIHLISADNYFLNDETRWAFQKAESVAFEIDLEEMMDFSNLLPVLMNSFMPDGMTLKDLVSAEDYILVQQHFSERGLMLDWFERIKPLFLSAMVGQEGTLTMGQQQEASKSYELEFLEMAKASQKDIHGLETTEFQMSLFDSIPLKEQADMLVSTIKSPSDPAAKNELDQLVQYYVDQDIHQLKNMISNEDSPLADHDYVLIDKRNINWIPKIKDLMHQKSTFFAVGAGHLAGENGVLRLLEKDGYVVTPVLHLTKS